MVEPTLFSNNQKKPQNASMIHLEQVKRYINDVASHLSVLEERYSNLRKKLQLIEKNLIDGQKDSKADLKAMRLTITEMNHKVNDVRDKISAMAGELTGVVKKEEFQILNKYMDFWEPMQFISREEAKQLIKDAKEEMKRNNNKEKKNENK